MSRRMRTSPPLVVVLALAVAVSGCASLYVKPPNAAVRANGRPLWVKTRIEVTYEKYKEKVGDIRTSEGDKVGTLYEVGTARRTEYLWQGHQGDQRIDAEAFFRIAGDDAALAEVKRARARATSMYRIGMGATIAGLALLPFMTTDTQDGTMIRPWVFVASFGLVSLGGLSWYFGWRRLDPDRHGVPDYVARDDAEAYNQRRRSSAMLGVTGSF